MRWPSADLSELTRRAPIGPCTSRAGVLDALIHVQDTALFPSTAVIEEPALGEAFATLTRGPKEH